MATIHSGLTECNTELARRNAVARLRRIAHKQNLRLLTHRNGAGYTYKLQAFAPIVSNWVTLDELNTVIEDLYCAEASR